MPMSNVIHTALSPNNNLRCTDHTTARRMIMSPETICNCNCLQSTSCPVYETSGNEFQSQSRWPTTETRWWMQKSTKRSPTFGQQSNAACRPLQQPTSTIAVYSYYSARKLIYFIVYVGERLSRYGWLATHRGRHPSHY